MNPYAPPLAAVEQSAAELTSNPLRVAFKNSRKDLILFQMYMQGRSPVFFLFMLAMAALIALTSLPDGSRGLAQAAILIGMALLAILGIYLFQLFFIVVWVLSHRDPNLYRYRTLELAERAVIDTTEVHRFELAWRAVHGVTKTPWGLYIRLTVASALCVPPRAFPDRESYGRYADTALAFFQRAKERAP